MIDIPDITRYDSDPAVVECLVPAAHGHLVYYTDHELVVDHLLYTIRDLKAQLVEKNNES